MPSSSRLTSCVRLLVVLVVVSASGCGPTRPEQLLELAHSTEIDQQRTALRELADIGLDAAPAIPDLIELSRHRHPDVRRLSGLALGNIAVALPAAELHAYRQDIIEVLTRLLDDKDQAVRNTSAFALLDLDPGHAPAQSRVTSAMRQGDGGIIDRLTHTQPSPTWAVPTLIDIASHDSRPGLRRLAVVALGQIDPDDQAAQKALQQALRDSDDRVRSAAQTAVRREHL